MTSRYASDHSQTVQPKLLLKSQGILEPSEKRDDNNKQVEGTENAFLSPPVLSENLGSITNLKCLDLVSISLANTHALESK